MNLINCYGIIGLLLVIMCQQGFGMYINEILYNPLGADGNNEFIEVFSDGIDIANYTLGDPHRNHTLSLQQWHNSSLVLIVKEGSPLIANSTSPTTIYTVKEFGNGLNNDGDQLWLYTPQQELIFSFAYTHTAPEGKSLEFDGTVYVPSLAVGGTPGTENSVLRHSIADASLTNDSYASDESLENNPIDPCTLTITTNKEEYSVGETVAMTFNATRPFDEIEYFIENEDGEVVHQPRFTKNLNTKRWKAKTKKIQEIMHIVTVLYSEACTTQYTKQITLHGLPHNSTKKPVAQNVPKKNAVQVSLGRDRMARFGETITLKLKYPPHDTVRVTLNKENTLLTMAAASPDTNKILLAVPPNCDQRYEEGVYRLLLEGGVTFEQYLPLYANTKCAQKITQKRNGAQQPSESLVHHKESLINASIGQFQSDDPVFYSNISAPSTSVKNISLENNSPEIYNTQLTAPQKQSGTHTALWDGISYTTITSGIVTLLVFMRRTLYA